MQKMHIANSVKPVAMRKVKRDDGMFHFGTY